MICGAHELSWDDFYRALYRAKLNGGGKGVDLECKDLYDRLIMSKTYFREWVQRPLLHILMGHRNTRATNPRDRIYAFFGLADPTEIHNLRVPMKYGPPYKQLYIDFASAVLRNTGT